MRVMAHALDLFVWFAMVGRRISMIVHSPVLYMDQTYIVAVAYADGKTMELTFIIV